MSKNLIASIIFSLGCIVFFVLVLPQYDVLGFAREGLKKEQALVDERTAEINNFINLDKEARSRQQDISKIITFLPAKKQVDEIVSSIQKASGDSGIQLINMTTSESAVTTEGKYKTISVGLDLVGGYPSFVNFLRLLEQNLRLYDITEIIGGVTAGGNTGAINFSVKINAYYLK